MLLCGSAVGSFHCEVTPTAERQSCIIDAAIPCVSTQQWVRGAVCLLLSQKRWAVRERTYMSCRVPLSAVPAQVADEEERCWSRPRGRARP